MEAKAFFATVLSVGSCSIQPDGSGDEALDDTIHLTYHEASATMAIGIDIGQIAEWTEGTTIELQIAVSTPDGRIEQHALGWSRGDDLQLPPIEITAVDEGVYEVALTELAVDRRTLAGPAVHAHMKLLGARGGGELGGGACPIGVTVHGTAGDDNLYGTGAKDEILGHGGDDVLHGLGCDDNLRGGKGNDILHGNQGDDDLDGGNHYDECYGGKGADVFSNCEFVQQD